MDICNYTDKCIYFALDECMGMFKECKTRDEIIAGKRNDETVIERIKKVDYSITGKAILVTGGSGSFGSAFCEYVKNNNLKPRKLVVFSRCPEKQRILKAKLGDLDYMVYRIGDIRDRDRLKDACAGIDIIIHSAALKYIEECEDEPREAKKINVDGTENIVESALYHKVQKTILISTDKAVESITTYGTTKAMAEALILGGNKYKGIYDVRFSVCRYGNVIGSNGSVVPIFKRLIDEGAECLPVTDERCTRFWFPMTSAIEFVLDSIEKMRGGEVFIPKIPSIRITDLCKAFNKPYKVVGLRCAEKIHEKLTADYDSGTNPNFLTIEQIRETIT